MTDLKAAAEAAKIQPHLGHHAEKLRDAAIDAFRGACTPDAILALYAERDEALERERQTFKDAAEINTRAEAALAVMECEGEAKPVAWRACFINSFGQDVWHFFETKPVGPAGAQAQPLYASPRPEAVGEAVKAERERCAKAAEQTRQEAKAMYDTKRDGHQQAHFHQQIFAAEEIATAIRARGET